MEQAAAKLAEVQPTTSAPGGRVEVEGTVIFDRYDFTDFGTVHKMKVKLTDNNTVWGTVPNSLSLELGENLRGSKIRFTATFTKADGDDHHSFYKRPAKAAVVTS